MLFTLVSLQLLRENLPKIFHLFFANQSNTFYFHGDFRSPFNPNYAVSPQRVWVTKFNLELEWTMWSPNFKAPLFHYHEKESRSIQFSSPEVNKLITQLVNGKARMKTWSPSASFLKPDGFVCLFIFLFSVYGKSPCKFPVWLWFNEEKYIFPSDQK